MTNIPVVLVILLVMSAPAACCQPDDEYLIKECPVPELKTKNDFYQINPALREQYYQYMTKTDPVDLNNSYRINNPPDDFIIDSRFQYFTLELVEQNKDLAKESRGLEQALRRYRPGQNTNVIRVQLEKIRKLSQKLGRKFYILVPPSFSSPPHLKEAEEYYRDVCAKMNYTALFSLLVSKLAGFENRFCAFLFPREHTVSVEELSMQSTPLVDILDIENLAAILSKNLAKSIRPPAQKR